MRPEAEFHLSRVRLSVPVRIIRQNFGLTEAVRLLHGLNFFL